VVHAREWLEEGDKVRAAIAFRGREMTHRELGAKILSRLTQDLTDIADVEVAPKLEGYQMFTIFLPKKGKADVKKAQPATAAAAPDEVEKKERAPRKPADAKPETREDDEIF
jgi:translation initiation factor IF-3